MTDDKLYFATAEVADVLSGGKAIITTETKGFSDATSLDEVMKWADETTTHSQGTKIRGDVRITVNEAVDNARQAKFFDQLGQGMKRPGWAEPTAESSENDVT